MDKEDSRHKDRVGAITESVKMKKLASLGLSRKALLAGKPDIRIGVINNNSATWLNDEMMEGIDPGWEELSEEEQEAICNGDDYYEQAEVFIGDWEKDRKSGLYKPGKRGEKGFAAEMSIGQFGSYTTCVYWSRWIIRCAGTSPCYIQEDGHPCGDLDTPRDSAGYIAYCLPPDMFDTDIDDFPVDRIVELYPKKGASK